MADTYTFEQLCEAVDMSSDNGRARVRHALTMHRIFPAGVVNGRYVYSPSALSTLEKHFSNPMSRKGMKAGTSSSSSTPAAAGTAKPSTLSHEEEQAYKRLDAQAAADRRHATIMAEPDSNKRLSLLKAENARLRSK